MRSCLFVLLLRLLPALLVAILVAGVLVAGAATLSGRTIDPAILPILPGAASPAPSEDPDRATPVPQPAPPADSAVATRIIIEDLDIDLPIVGSDLRLPGEPADYPFCDVAQYLDVYAQPGQVGTTYVYAHARPGMFAPLLDASEKDDGRSLLGMTVSVFTSDARRYDYRITEVRRHATDFSLADDLLAGERRLVLQTSEGPSGTLPKLQVAAAFLGTTAVSHRVAVPEAAPRPCR